MGHNDDGQAVTIQFLKQRDDGFPGGLVEISSRFVRQQQLGIIDQWPGNGSSLAGD